MASKVHSSSILAQTLDRPVFVSYFLGAIVPLIALAFVVQRYVIPTLEGKFAQMGIVAIVLAVSVLTLSAFLLLRKTTRQTLDRLDDDNTRLSELLKVSRALSSASRPARR